MALRLLRGGVWASPRPYVLRGGVWAPVKSARVLRNLSTEPQNPNWQWVPVAYFGPPTIVVPAVNIVRSPDIVNPEARVIWSTVTNPDAPAYDWRVQIDWYQNGARIAGENRPQANGQTPWRAVAYGHSYYARLHYFNDWGEGPEVQTPTLFV